MKNGNLKSRRGLRWFLRQKAEGTPEKTGKLGQGREEGLGIVKGFGKDFVKGARGKGEKN